VSALVQGGLIRRLVPRVGEPRLILTGLATLAAGMAALALVGSGAALVGATFVVGVGQGLTSPTISGLLSRVTPPSEQGAVFGTYSSAQTLSRMISYTVANLVLARMGPAGPYWAACAIAAVALVLAIVVVGPMGKPEVDRDFDDSDRASAEVVAPRS
jgi:DHA1 family tetracycline resistance protein-like MFS transporter